MVMVANRGAGVLTLAGTPPDSVPMSFISSSHQFFR